ncbi:hypothetical protein K443DRAFT_71838, partial [Laccaria amethystina LaAM-08-1]
LRLQKCVVCPFLIRKFFCSVRFFGYKVCTVRFLIRKFCSVRFLTLQKSVVCAFLVTNVRFLTLQKYVLCAFLIRKF